MKDIILQDNEDLNMTKSCVHDFRLQADIMVDGIVWDIFYCARCLTHAKKERPCPMHLDVKD